MPVQAKINTHIQKAEDLPTVFSTQTNWLSIKECKRTIFRSLDIKLVTVRKITLLDAMDAQVDAIIADALTKGILEKKQDGTIYIKASNA